MSNDSLEQIASALVADGKGKSRARAQHGHRRQGVSRQAPWTITFSDGRALQDRALQAWGGRDENVGRGQHALGHRARCNRAASLGAFTEDMEKTA